MSNYYFTPGGFERLCARIRNVRAAYQAVCDDNPEALESGDTSGWHDNFAFEENQRQMHQLARRVRDLEVIKARSETYRALAGTPERVVLGASVVLQYEDEEAPRRVWIAGWDDGNPTRGRVSYNSPLGTALIGAEPGEEREVRIEKMVRKLEVLEVGPTPAEDACLE